jgi:phage/plasmid-like protein (TIGR03299 family)
MASEITEQDQLFYFGEVPWHGLGVSVNQLLTSEEALQAANLDWNVSLQDLYLENNQKVPRVKATVRDDTQEVLGVVGRLYTPLQNREAFDFADSLLPEGPGRYEVAGSLNRGARVWMLAKISEDEVVSNDLVQDYLLLTNRHDGLGTFQILLTSVRVVCANTLTQALSFADKIVRMKHTPGRINERSIVETQNSLGIVTEFTKFLRDIDRQLAWTKFDRELQKTYVESLVPVRPLASERERNSAEKKQKQLLELFESSPGNDLPGVAGTAYAMKNAITDYADHYSRIRVTKDSDPNEVRMLNSVFGSSNEWKHYAIDKLKQTVGV